MTALAGVALAAPAVAATKSSFVNAPDVVVFCDPALRAPVGLLGDRFRADTGVPVRMLCAPARIMAGQLERNERDDILITLRPIVHQLAASGLAHPQSMVGTWRNRLVIARKGAGAAPVALARLDGLLAGGRLGMPDPSVNAIVDAPALLDRLGLRQALAGRIAGEIDTGGVAWLLEHDQVALGLVLGTEAREHGFSEAVTLPDAAYPPILYEAAFSRHVRSRHGAAFMQSLSSPRARASLVQHGLEIVA